MDVLLRYGKISKSTLHSLISHRLNLSVAKACKIICVQNMLDMVKVLSEFFKYGQHGRQLSLEDSIKQHAPETVNSKLNDPCNTRCIERIKGLDLCQELFVSIWHVLDDMIMNVAKSYNDLIRNRAKALFNAIDYFEFVVNLMVTRNVFDLTVSAPILKKRHNGWYPYD